MRSLWMAAGGAGLAAVVVVGGLLVQHRVAGAQAGLGERGEEWSMSEWSKPSADELPFLRDAEEDIRTDPDSEYLQAKVKYLQKRVKDLESQGPRLAADHPLEISLWAPPHG